MTAGKASADVDCRRERKRARSRSRLPISALLSSPVDLARSCAVCLAHPVVDGRACAECSTGSFCIDCLGEYVRAAVKDRALLPLRCGEAQCRAVIPAAAVAGAVDRELARRYRVAVEDRETQARRVRRRVEARIGAGAGAAPPDRDAAQETDGDEELDEEDEAVLELLRTEGWQRCPDCGIGVEKVLGCRHMKCVCGGQFCYGCGARWGLYGCTRRCGFDALAMLPGCHADGGVGTDVWHGLAAQLSQHMLRTLQDLHNQADRQRCGIAQRLDIVAASAFAGTCAGSRRRGRRSRGLSVEELVHGWEPAVPTEADYRGPSLPHLTASMALPSFCRLETPSSRRSMKMSSLVLHNLDFLVHDRDQPPYR